jgi:hypothetical protein
MGGVVKVAGAGVSDPGRPSHRRCGRGPKRRQCHSDCALLPAGRRGPWPATSRKHDTTRESSPGARRCLVRCGRRGKMRNRCTPTANHRGSWCQARADSERETARRASPGSCTRGSRCRRRDRAAPRDGTAVEDGSCTRPARARSPAPAGWRRGPSASSGRLAGVREQARRRGGGGSSWPATRRRSGAREVAVALGRAPRAWGARWVLIPRATRAPAE